MAITFTRFDEALQMSFESLKAEGVVSDYVGTLLVDIYKMSDEVVESLSDGFSVRDISILASIVPGAMKMVNGLSDLSGEEKKSLVRDIILVVYTAIDRGADGKQNNIDLPLVFGPIERKVERMMISFITNTVVDGLYGYMKSKGDLKVNEGA